MLRRQRLLKSSLWFMVGVLASISVLRFLRGLGATTSLTDATPWGLWIAFDVMSGVALAAGGFVVAATVYIFGRQKYKAFARPAILTAFLGYAAVTVGLLYDLGLPMNIWHPILYPQPHSVLFEVGMCVIFYLTVLFLEFCPVILEHPLFDRDIFRKLHQLLRKLAIPLVIAGIVLSTLHQSSLGSLFLIAPYRVHPLWYSPIIWILFLASAVGLGLMVVIAESLFSSWFFGHRPRVELMSKLAKAASVVLFIYLGLRFGDLGIRNKLGSLAEADLATGIFLLEICLVLGAAVLMWFRRIRTSTYGLGVGSTLTILGIIGYRFNVCVVAFMRPSGMSYFPSWIEVTVTLGIIAGALLIFIFFVENLKVFVTDEHISNDNQALQVSIAICDPHQVKTMLPDSLEASRLYSLSAVFGAAISLAVLSGDVGPGALLTRNPASHPLQIAGSSEPRSDIAKLLQTIWIRPAESVTNQSDNLFILDGNRNGRLALFDHEAHSSRLGGELSCRGCHHQDLPYRKNTGCHKCHQDMYIKTDIFNHSSHVSLLGGNEGCIRCHREDEEVRNRESATVCSECHLDFLKENTWVPSSQSSTGGLAVGYTTAMHGLCVNCHKRFVEENPEKYEVQFSECAHCHKEVGPGYLRTLRPYGLTQLGI